MSNLVIIPAVNITTAEQLEALYHLTNPATKKYLLSLALVEASDILSNGDPESNESAEGFMRRTALVRGRMDALNGLVALEVPKGSTSIDADNGNFAG